MLQQHVNSINKTFGCCSKIFGCSNKKKLFVVPNFVAVKNNNKKTFFPCKQYWLNFWGAVTLNLVILFDLKRKS